MTLEHFKLSVCSVWTNITEDHRGVSLALQSRGHSSPDQGGGAAHQTRRHHLRSHRLILIIQAEETQETQASQPVRE